MKSKSSSKSQYLEPTCNVYYCKISREKYFMGPSTGKSPSKKYKSITIYVINVSGSVFDRKWGLDNWILKLIGY
jgi:hypothetical protein